MLVVVGSILVIEQQGYIAHASLTPNLRYAWNLPKSRSVTPWHMLQTCWSPKTVTRIFVNPEIVPGWMRTRLSSRSLVALLIIRPSLYYLASYWDHVSHTWAVERFRNWKLGISASCYLIDAKRMGSQLVNAQIVLMQMQPNHLVSIEHFKIMRGECFFSATARLHTSNIGTSYASYC